MADRAFSKHLRRRGNPYEPSHALHVDSLARRATTTTSSAAAATSSETTSAGLSPKAIVIVLGSLAILWLFFVMIGIMCKYFNRPRSAAHSGAYLSGNQLYQPSAAGYGGPNGARAPSQSPQDPAKMYGSKTNLLAGASPMGQAGDSSFDGPGTPDLSMSQSREYFGEAPSMPAGRAPGQHHRSTSSSVGMPGPAATPRRGGGGSQHPPVGPSSGPGPDAGGFRPGQVFNYAALGGPGGGPAGPRLPTGPPSGRPGGGAVGVGRSNSKVMRGPPPARSNSKRRSRYSRAPRVESLGPGQIRASRYMDEADWEQQEMMDVDDHPQNYSRRSRVGSIGQGAGRRSVYGGGIGRNGSIKSNHRSPSIYGANMAEEEAIRRAQAEGFGGGGGAPAGPRGGPYPPGGPPGGYQQGGRPGDPLGAQGPRGPYPGAGGGPPRGPGPGPGPYPYQMQQQQQMPPQMRYPGPGGPGRPMGPGMGPGGPPAGYAMPNRQPQLAGAPSRQLL